VTSVTAAADHGAAMDRIYRRQRHFYDLTRKYYLFGRDTLIAGLGMPRSLAAVGIGGIDLCRRTS